MKNTSLVLLAATLFGALQAPAWALSCENGYFPIYCRGKLFYEMDATMPAPSNGLAQPIQQVVLTIRYSKLPRNAGTGGIFVTTPGTCAWADRAMTAQEPSAMQSFAGSDNISSSMMQPLTRCLEDSTCVFGGCAARNGSEITLYPWNITISH
jgi:hypothetical protein